MWENILSYKEKFPQYKVILFTEDDAFNQDLEMEYKDKFGENIEILKNIDSILNYLVSMAENVPSSLIEDIKESKYIRESLQGKINDLQNQYKYWLEDLQAYGSGIEIIKISDLIVNNILPSKYSSYEIDNDYFALIRVKASGFQNGISMLFHSDVHLDVSIDESNEIIFEIIGLTLLAED